MQYGSNLEVEARPPARGPIAEATASEPGTNPADPIAGVLDALEYALTQGQGANPLLIERTARRLGMSSRTLQRRLRASGTSFTDLLQRKREFCAMDMLCNGGRPLAEIADALGFSEHSAFSRAFKRWTGTSPTRFRNSRRGRLTLVV